MHKLFVGLVTTWQRKNLKNNVCVWNFVANLVKILQRHFNCLTKHTGKGSPRPKKAWMSRSKIKVLLAVFFDWKGIVHHEFVPCGQMVNKQLYQEVLAHLRDTVRRNCGKTRLGCCSTTMCQLTCCSSSAVIWQNIRHLLCPIHPIL